MIINDMQTITQDQTIETTQGLWVGGAGDVVVVTAKGTTVTIEGVAAGTLLPIAVKKVVSSGTTATKLRACYGV